MNEVLRSLRFCTFLIFRPFKGFWDLKHERRGNLATALVIVALTTATEVFRRQATGFLFNAMTDTSSMNLLAESLTIIVPLVLWTVSNWCLTALMDGDGSFRDIFVATSYALAPMILVNVPLIGLSHLIIAEEGAFYWFFSALAVVWTGGLILLGTMVTHQFTLAKTILVAVLTIVGMGLIIFIMLLFFDLLQKMYSFGYTVFMEVVFRM